MQAVPSAFVSKDRKIVLGVVVGVLFLLVLGNLVYAIGNNRVDDVRGWPDVELGADDVVAYKSTSARPLHLHVFHPQGAPSPVLVLFHGGGLRDIRLEQFVPQAERLNAAGYSVAVAEFRVSSDGASRADSASDATDAIAWLRTNGSDLGVDSSFVAAGGASAGGWLAVESAHVDDPPDALVLFNPAVNASNVPTAAVPMIIFHAATDTVVPIDRVEDFCTIAADCELDVWPVGDHGFFNAGEIPEAYENSMVQTERFLDDLTG